MGPASPGYFMRLPAAITAGAAIAGTANSRLLYISAFFGGDSTAITAYYLQFFNLAGAPVNNSSVPVLSFAMIPFDAATRDGEQKRLTLDFGPQGLYFNTGIAYGLSDNPVQYSDPASASVLELFVMFGPSVN